MRGFRNVSFVVLVGALMFYYHAASLKAQLADCNPPAYGYGYATVFGNGTCGTVNVEQDCWGACAQCFEVEDYGDVVFCDDNNDNTGQWYDAVCDCGIAPR